MSDEYTPTTEKVREAYVRALRNAFIASTGEHIAEFDRWLAGELAKAWDEGYGSGSVDGYFETREEKNPYRKERTDA